jgi:hypothetical protein
VRVALVLLASCSSTAPLSDACDPATLPLIETPGNVHVPVTQNGSAAVLLVDTGSPTTFLQQPLGSPDPTPDAGSIVLACTTVELDGRPESPDQPVNGVPSIGTLGVDRVLGGELDLAGAALRTTDLDDASTWPAAPFDLVDGLVLAHVELGGMPVRLMLDTGSSDTLWLGQGPQPGDVEIDAVDAEGNTIPMYKGTVELAIGTWHGTVAVLRAPSFPYFEQTVADLGGNVAGLLGLSALGQGVELDTQVHVDL